MDEEALVQAVELAHDWNMDTTPEQEKKYEKIIKDRESREIQKTGK